MSLVIQKSAEETVMRIVRRSLSLKNNLRFSIVETKKTFKITNDKG